MLPVKSIELVAQEPANLQRKAFPYVRDCRGFWAAGGQPRQEIYKPFY